MSLLPNFEPGPTHGGRPLIIIAGNIAFLERGTADATAKRQLGTMRVATERGANLTAQLLAFSRRQRLEPKSVDLNVTVGAMRDMV